MQSKSFDDDYFIKNAILCFLYHYPNHKWTGIYEELAERDTFTKATTRTQQRLMPTETTIILAVVGMLGLFATATVYQRSNRITSRYYGKK